MVYFKGYNVIIFIIIYNYVTLSVKVIYFIRNILYAYQFIYTKNAYHACRIPGFFGFWFFFSILQALTHYLYKRNCYVRAIILLLHMRKLRQRHSVTQC